MLVKLNVEVGQEPGGSDDDERWVRRILPEQVRKDLQGLLRQIVRNDEREACHILAPLWCLEQLLERAGISYAVDALVELAQEGHRLRSARFSDACVSVEEEVVPCISRGRRGVVEDGKVSDTGKDEVLEDGSGGRRAGGDEYP
jgi:hypothetical protein